MTPLRLVAVLALAWSLLAIGPPPAYACSCAQMATDGHVRAADVVVRGTVDARRPAGPGGVDAVTYTVSVEDVYKGEVTRDLDVRSAASGASCGLENVDLGGEYVVFAYVEGDAHWVNLCGGTAPASPDLLQNIERSTGPATEPAQWRPGSGAGAGTSTSQHQRSRAAAGPPAVSWTAGLVGVGAVGVAALLARARRIRRASPGRERLS